jgi:hypothetical protein
MPRARIVIRGSEAERPLAGRAGTPLLLPLRVRNLCQRRFPASASYGRRLVRVGAQLAGEDGSLLDRDHARAALPADLQPGRSVDLSISLPLPPTPGRYQVRLDLVSEGIDWFEHCGSEVTVRDLVVT